MKSDARATNVFPQLRVNLYVNDRSKRTLFRECFRASGVDTENINARSVKDGLTKPDSADITLIEYHHDSIAKTTDYIDSQLRQASFGVRPVFIIDIRHVVHDRVEILKAREAGADIFFTSPLNNKLIKDAVSKSISLQVRTDEIAERFMDVESLTYHCLEELHQVNDTVKLNLALDQLRIREELATFVAIARRQPDHFLSSRNKLTLAKLLIDLKPERSELLLNSLVDIGVFYHQANTALYETYMTQGKERLATEALIRSQVTRSDDAVLFKQSFMALVKQGNIKATDSFFSNYLSAFDQTEERVIELFGVLYETTLEYPDKYTQFASVLTPVLLKHSKRWTGHLSQQATIFGYLIDAVGLLMIDKPLKAMVAFDSAKRMNGPHGYLFEEMQLVELMYLSLLGEFNQANRTYNRIEQNEKITEDTLTYNLVMDRYREMVDAEKALTTAATDDHQVMMFITIAEQFKYSDELVNRSIFALNKYASEHQLTQRFVMKNKKRFSTMARTLNGLKAYRGPIPSIKKPKPQQSEATKLKDTWRSKLVKKLVSGR